MSVNGTYACILKSPMGEQKMTITLYVTDGALTGHVDSAQGDRVPCEDGAVDGQTATWKMKVTKPMPITMDCKAEIDGDTLTGTVKPGPFGTFPLTGTRTA